MPYPSNTDMIVDHDLRNALIRANIALLQREREILWNVSVSFSLRVPHTYIKGTLEKHDQLTIKHRVREKKDWYTSRRVVVRKRNGRIHLSRLGSRKQTEYVPVEFEEDSQDSSFTLTDETVSSRSTSFSSNY
ncbi:hypothetical protein F4814DRAFT_453038 [Daldinia grandis]|nr:hypothetical protein F4814DRAFT_453038 [Daldinia grandis]